MRSSKIYTKQKSNRNTAYLENWSSTVDWLLLKHNTFEYKIEFTLATSSSSIIITSYWSMVCVKARSDFRNFSFIYRKRKAETWYIMREFFYDLKAISRWMYIAFVYNVSMSLDFQLRLGVYIKHKRKISIPALHFHQITLDQCLPNSFSALNTFLMWIL